MTGQCEKQGGKREVWDRGERGYINEGRGADVVRVYRKEECGKADEGVYM